MNLFTVCIPTYNRAGFLDKALGAILPQIAARTEEKLGVYVSNNCSTDNTDDVIQKYLTQYPDILKYKRQTHVLIPHMPDVLASVDSKFVALMGDDDFVMPGYVDRILSCITEHPDLGLINYNIINYRGEKCFDLRDSMFCSGKGKYYERGGEFVKEHHHRPSLMSSNVFLLDEYLKAQSGIDYKRYPGYGWFMALLKGAIHRPCYYIDTPMVWANQPPNVAWEKDALRNYMVGLGRVFKDLDMEYSGLYANWMKVFQTTWFNSKCLHLAFKYRETTSRQYFHEVIQYAYSPKYARQLKIRIFYPRLFVRYYLHFKDRILPRILHHIPFFK